ncbi:MAG: fibronectin type III domain-containing protein [Bacteroidales bacterium]|nr:fibronectin type III domain-containing protein [Bacteroidales bacterium]
MKKYLYILAAAAAVSTVSCQKAETEVSEVTEMVHMEVISPSTKTYLHTDGTTSLWNATGEKIMVLQTAGTRTTYTESAEGTTGDGGHTMSFGVDLEASDATSFSYYSIYPSANYVIGSNLNVEALKVITPTAQKPSATCFDPKADLLISSKVESATQPATLSMSYARKVALGVMKILNLNTTENVVSVKFESEGKSVTGRSRINLNNGHVDEYGYSGSSFDNVTMDYSGQTIAANGMTAYFFCMPFNLAEGDSFKVTVRTESLQFTRVVTLAGAQQLQFKAGDQSSFNVDFSGIEGVVVAHDIRYAVLSASEVSSLSYSYTSAGDYVQPNGANWSIAATKNSSNIQLGDATSNKNAGKSYIKLPDFVKDIRKVIVTLDGPVSDKTLALVPDKETKPADDEKIASITTDNTLTQTIDLESQDITGIKTAYLRGDATFRITKIEVYAGPDNRTALAAPSNVQATVDASTPNKINVSWEAVTGAESYVVTATPASGEPVEENVTTTSVSFSGLQYSTQYAVTVLAKAADISVNIDSPASAAVNVTTGSAATSKISYNLVSDVANLTAGKYLIATNNKSALYNGRVSSGHLQTVETGSALGSTVLPADVPATAREVDFTAVTGVENAYYLSVDGKYIYLSATGSGKFKIDGTEAFQWNFSNVSGAGLDAVGATIASHICSYNNGSFRSYGSMGNGQSIYLYKLVDNRDALAAPTGMTATLDDTDNTKINVTWNAVANAGGYVLKATPAEGQTVVDTVKVGTATSGSLTGLAYEKAYTVSMYAIPSDVNNYKNSAVVTYPTAVTTGANTSNVVVLDQDAITAAHTSNWTYTSGDKAITAADGSVWHAYNTFGNANQKTLQMNKGKNAYLLSPVVSGSIRRITVVQASSNAGNNTNGTRVMDVLTPDGTGTIVSSSTLNGVSISGTHNQVRIIANETSGGATYIVSVTIEYE